MLWIFLSAVVIMVNKYVLTWGEFPYPIALTLTHMAFCACLAFLLIKAGFVDTIHMDSNTYFRCGQTCEGAINRAWPRQGLLDLTNQCISSMLLLQTSLV